MTKHFKNTYYLMRHGQSEANIVGLIISNPTIACYHYGLTPTGQQQVLTAISSFSAERPTAIICSDFLRTQQTAQLVATQLGLASPVVDLGLRERFFGQWEGLSDSYYKNILLSDKYPKKQNTEGVEKVEQVLQRGLGVLKRLESEYKNKVLLLVSHGDMVQILQTAFTGLAASEHRQLPHHSTAEIRLLASQGEPHPPKLKTQNTFTL